jgi:hypothetical protein
MVIRVMLDGLFKQLNMTWCRVVYKTTMCNVHVDGCTLKIKIYIHLRHNVQSCYSHLGPNL